MKIQTKNLMLYYNENTLHVNKGIFLWKPLEIKGKLRPKQKSCHDLRALYFYRYKIYYLNNGTSVRKSIKYSEWIEDSNCKLMDLCGLRAVESFYP